MGALIRRATPRTRALAGAGALLAGAALGSLTRPLSAYAAVAVAVPVLVVLAVVVRRPGASTVGAPHRRTALAWGLLLALAAAWEVAAWLQQPAYDVASPDHPTASVLLDPLTDAPASRLVAWGCWLYLGYHLVRRRVCVQ